LGPGNPFRGRRKKKYVKFEVFKEVAMKNAVFWDVTPCDSWKNRRIVYIMKVKRISELGTLAVTSN
jgi:hypothetical protein